MSEAPRVGSPMSTPTPEVPPMSDVPVVTAPELVRRLAARQAGTDDFLLIDVREPAEYAQASIPGAVLVPLNPAYPTAPYTQLSNP